MSPSIAISMRGFVAFMQMGIQMYKVGHCQTQVVIVFMVCWILSRDGFMLIIVRC